VKKIKKKQNESR